MLKSMRRTPVPQPPAAVSAWMIWSEVALFGCVETSVFQGFDASKSWPSTVVEVTVLVVVVVLGRDVVVLGRDVDVLAVEVVEDEVLEDDVLEPGDDELDVELEVDVVREVEVELDVVEDDEVVERGAGLVVVEMVGREVELLVVVEVDVVLFFRLFELRLDAHVQALQPCPPQSAAVSHSSPAATSSRPSPQVDAGAVNCRRFAPRPTKVAVRLVHASSTCAFRRTWRSGPHAPQRTRTMVRPFRCDMRARADGQPLATLA